MRRSDYAIYCNFGHNRGSGVKYYIFQNLQFRYHRTQFYMYNNRVALIQALAPNCEYRIIFLFALNSSYTLYHNTSSFYMSYSPYPSHTHIVCVFNQHANNTSAKFAFSLNRYETFMKCRYFSLFFVMSILNCKYEIF